VWRLVIHLGDGAKATNKNGKLPKLVREDELTPGPQLCDVDRDGGSGCVGCEVAERNYSCHRVCLPHKKNEFIFHQSLDRMMEKGVTYYNGMGTEPLLIKSDVSKKNRVKKNKREKQKIRIHVHWHS
jgi:hypothetical protein